tara:strand:+ start:595 stop:747 length:153 start_codon:yes stop_codon:yes gene_type:complete
MIRIRNNIPIGNVKYKNLKGTSNRLLTPTSPIAFFIAKSNSLLIPLTPYF